VVIPYKSVVEQLGEFFVYVTQEGDKVTQVKILPGKQIGKDILVREGLKEGDSIVVEGVQNLREGSSIATAKPEEKKQAAN
jgi:membrane fusion protein (multidrug efflux system)